MSRARLHPLRRDHLRLLRHPDRLGAGHPQRPPAGARPARGRRKRGRAARALRAARGRARGRRRISPIARSWRSRCAGSARELGFDPSDADADGFARAIGEWPAFHDTAPALRRLQQRFRLGVITNCDRDLFALSNRRLGVTFDWVVAARGRAGVQAEPGAVRARLRDDRRAARAHPARRPEPLPRPRARQAAWSDDGMGRPAPRPGGLRRHATRGGDAGPDGAGHADVRGWLGGRRAR